jgi:N-acetylated-alpha-linked acidic dipeptidase
MEEIPVLLSYPIRRSVELIAPGYYNCTLKEAVVEKDGTSANVTVDTFNGYAPTGTAEGELVYVNYGRLEDFELLDNLSIL